MKNDDFLNLLKNKLSKGDKKIEEETLKVIKTWLSIKRSDKKGLNQEAFDIDKAMDFLKKAKRSVSESELKERKKTILNILKSKHKE